MTEVVLQIPHRMRAKCTDRTPGQAVDGETRQEGGIRQHVIAADAAFTQTVQVHKDVINLLRKAGKQAAALRGGTAA